MIAVWRAARSGSQPAGVAWLLVTVGCIALLGARRGVLAGGPR